MKTKMVKSGVNADSPICETTGRWWAVVNWWWSAAAAAVAGEI